MGGRVDVLLQGAVDTYPNPGQLLLGNTTLPPTVNTGLASGARPVVSPLWLTSQLLSDTQPLGDGVHFDYPARLQAVAQMTMTSSPLHTYYDPPFTIQSDGGSYSVPLYQMPLNTPRVPVYTNRQRATLQPVFDLGVPMPDPTLIPGGLVGASGTDAEAGIWCGNEYWEFWQLHPANPNAAVGSIARTGADLGYTWVCSQGGHITDITQISSANFHGGFYSGASVWGVLACGMSTLCGRLTAEDYWSGTISHALSLKIPLTLAGQLAPATRHDSFNFTNTPDAVANSYKLPQGAWFRLPVGFDTVGWAAAHHTQAAQNKVEMMCRAARDYGLIIDDSATVCQFDCEGTQSFGSPYNPWTANQAPNWGHVGIDLPWDQFQFLTPRVA
jgi:hypothetical protein